VKLPRDPDLELESLGVALYFERCIHSLTLMVPSFVLAVANGFKVFPSIIQFVAVSVVPFQSFGGFAKYQKMEKAFIAGYISMRAYLPTSG